MNVKLELKKLHDIRESWNKPGVLVAVCASVTVLILIIIYFQFLFPVQTERVDTLRELESIRADKEALMALPNPEQVTEAQIAGVKDGLPLRPETLPLIEDIHALELASGVEVTGYRLDSGAEEGTDLLEQVASSGTGILQEGGTEQQAAAPQTGAGQAEAQKPKQELQYGLTVSGSYDRLIDFMDRLHKLPRIVSLNSWTLTPNSNPAILFAELARGGETSTAGAAAADVSYTLNADITVYYAPQFAARFSQYAAGEGTK